MRSAVGIVALVVVVGMAGCSSDHPSGANIPTLPETAAALPDSAETPLLLDSAETPLLLDEAGPGAIGASGEGADNSRCAVCHLNLVVEELAQTHAAAGIGCADCHGASDEHIADESWASGGNGTPPDIMFRPAEVNPGCLKCHPADQLDPEIHREALAVSSGKDRCTDCHGEHRVPVRKCRWK